MDTDKHRFFQDEDGLILNNFYPVFIWVYLCPSVVKKSCKC